MGRGLGISRSTTGPASRRTSRPPLRSLGTPHRGSRRISRPISSSAATPGAASSRSSPPRASWPRRCASSSSWPRTCSASTPTIRREHSALLALLEQEFAIRVLHITDFFVEAREELLLEQEASYRRAIDHAPACIFMADAADGRIFAANQVAEQLLGLSARRARGAARASSCYPPAERPRAAALLRAAQEQGHASRDDLHLIAHRPAARPGLRHRRPHRVRRPPLAPADLRRHLRPQAPREPAHPVREDGGHRPARRRHRARAAQSARHRHERALRPAAGARRGAGRGHGGPAHRGGGDQPRPGDHQEPARVLARVGRRARARRRQRPPHAARSS